MVKIQVDCSLVVVGGNVCLSLQQEKGLGNTSFLTFGQTQKYVFYSYFESIWIDFLFFQKGLLVSVTVLLSLQRVVPRPFFIKGLFRETVSVGKYMLSEVRSEGDESVLAGTRCCRKYVLIVSAGLVQNSCFVPFFFS